MTAPRIEQGGTYEMFWDCEYCGTAKLLGLTHRFCPHCGAPQNPAKRYFPPDAEKVAAKDHAYVGADKVCPACSNPNSAKSDFCSQCGSPLTDAARARRQADETKTPGGGQFVSTAEAPPGAPKKGRKWLWPVVGGVLVLFVLLAVFWKKEVSLELRGHSWERSIAIETFRAVGESGWCDSLPGDAYGISHSQKVRSTRQIPDGESCSTRRVDQGDGSYREQRECETTYREEPIYDDYCHYSVDRWVETHAADASGSDRKPYWPALNLAKSGSCMGCEREGARRENYYLHLHGADGKDYQCAVDPGVWQQAPPQSAWRMRKRVLSGGCGELAPL